MCAGSIHTLRIRYCASMSKQQKAVPWNTKQLQAVVFRYSLCFWLRTKTSAYIPFNLFSGPRFHRCQIGRGCAEFWARSPDPLSCKACPTWDCYWSSLLCLTFCPVLASMVGPNLPHTCLCYFTQLPSSWHSTYLNMKNVRQNQQDPI